MENTGIRDEVIQEIYTLAEKYNIKKVILFGSRARGDFKMIILVIIFLIKLHKLIRKPGTGIQ